MPVLCQYYLPLMFKALEKLDLSAYPLIVSSESGPAKGVKKAPGAKHICYCHTPMRYLYDMYDEYYANAGLAGKCAMRLFSDAMRRRDARSAEGVDVFVANSSFVRERIKRIYHRDAEVVNPPVEVDFFRPRPEEKIEKQDYYLFVGELTGYKRPELALQSCLELKRPLVIVGDGPEKNGFSVWRETMNLSSLPGGQAGKNCGNITLKPGDCCFPAWKISALFRWRRWPQGVRWPPMVQEARRKASMMTAGYFSTIRMPVP